VVELAGDSGMARAVGLARVSASLAGDSRMARFNRPLNLYGPLTTMTRNRYIIFKPVAPARTNPGLNQNFHGSRAFTETDSISGNS
jgi:hypothetical protein